MSEPEIPGRPVSDDRGPIGGNTPGGRDRGSGRRWPRAEVVQRGHRDGQGRATGQAGQRDAGARNERGIPAACGNAVTGDRSARASRRGGPADRGLVGSRRRADVGGGGWLAVTAEREVVEDLARGQGG